MPVLNLILGLVILGLILFGVNALPIPGWIKTVIHVVCAIAVVLWIAGMFGVHTGIYLR